MFNITLYKYQGKLNRINKKQYLATVAEISTDKIDSGTDVLHPSFVYRSSDGTAPAFNYAYIAEFGRYYFVTDIVWIGHNCYTVKCDIDPLYTYADRILLGYGRCTRTSDPTTYNTSLVDNLVVIEPEETTATKDLNIQTAFRMSTQNNIIITTAAKAN